MSQHASSKFALERHWYATVCVPPPHCALHVSAAENTQVPCVRLNERDVSAKMPNHIVVH